MVQRVYHGDHSRESGNEYAKLVDDYRKTLVQIIGGAFLLYTLYLTQRRTKAAEETLRTTQKSLEFTQKSLEITRETQVTDRFTKAIGQLGATDSHGKKQIETRLGAIYSLERIAKDSPDDYWPIVEILSAYVRQNAPWQEAKGKDTEIPPEPEKDIQAVVTVIGRRKYEQDKSVQLSLYEVDLRRVNLPEAYLNGANLWRAHLEAANFAGAHLELANLVDAHLELAILVDAHLEGAKLWRAHLKGTNLAAAHLEGADFSDALGLVQKQISAAYGDSTTKLPQGLIYPEHWASNSVPSDG